MAISKIKVGNTEHELQTTIANVSGLQTALDGKLPKSGGTMNDGATIKLSTYGSRFVTLSGNSITADMSNETGGWAGNFAAVKDPSGATTSMLGWYGSATGLNHIYMGGTYSDPFLKFTPQGQFTFKNTPRVGTKDIALKSDIPSFTASPDCPNGSVYIGAKGSVLLKGNDGIHVTTNEDGSVISITPIGLGSGGTDTNTTYDLSASKNSTNGNAKINLTAGGSGSGTDSVTIKGTGGTTVTTDANGVVTINSPTSSSGGSTVSSEMPLISFTGTSYSSGTPYLYEGDTMYLHLKKIGGGAFQLGDRLELCALRQSCRSQKEQNAGEIRYRLRALFTQDITQDIIDNADENIAFAISGNAKYAPQLFCNDSTSEKRCSSSTIHIRVRRPIYTENGKEYNAKFSNLITLEKTYTIEAPVITIK